MTNTLPLSIIILTHRCDERFERSLQSAQFADEILVIDFASERDWEKMREKCSFKLIRKKTKKIINFSKQRNIAIEEAKNEYILFIDSDEILEDDAAQKIEKIIKNTAFSGATIKRIDVFHNKELKWGEVYNVRIPRLFKAKNATYQNAVHESAIVTGKTIDSDITILHNAHTSIAEFFTDITQYAYIDATQRFTAGNYPKYTGLLFTKMILYPSGKFIYTFFIKLGFLDGWRGLVYSSMMSMHSFFVRAMIYEKKKQSTTTSY